jgi:hypothetical protein
MQQVLPQQLALLEAVVPHLQQGGAGWGMGQHVLLLMRPKQNCMILCCENYQTTSGGQGQPL